jgi:hypothetical protein
MLRMNIPAMLIAIALALGSSQERQGPPKLPPLEDPPGKPATKAEPPGNEPAVQVSPAPLTESGSNADEQPLLGVWKVVRLVRPKLAASKAGGYLVFTRTWLAIQLLLEPSAAGAPRRFQSSVRRYRVVKNQLLTNSAGGLASGARAGEIVSEQPGSEEARTFSLTRKRYLRIWQGVDSWIDLERQED